MTAKADQYSDSAKSDNWKSIGDLAKRLVEKAAGK